MSAGTVVVVEEVTAGSELALDTIGGGTYGSGTYGSGTYGSPGGAVALVVEDPTDFAPEGGELDLGGDELGYSTVDEDTGVVTLDAELVGSFTVGERVTPLPVTVERFAEVQLEDQDETLLARVPHGLFDRLPVGIRDPNVDEVELVELGRAPDGELLVADVLERSPVVDLSFADPDSIPTSEVTDGLAPSVSPTPQVLGGIASLFVSWVPVANHDLVRYEVHVSTLSGFTPSVGTFAGETPGTLFVVRNLPGTTNPPLPGTTYYVKLIAKDADGPAAASTQTAATPADGMDETIITDFLAANVVTAEKLAVIIALTSSLVAGTPGAQRLELGYGTDGADIDETFLGIRAFEVDGVTQNFRVDALAGEVYLKGRLDWGTLSRLLANDIVEIQEQPSTTFETPQKVQGAGASSESSTAAAWWASQPSLENALFAFLAFYDPDGTAPTPTTPTDWALVTSVANGELRGRLYRYTGTAPPPVDTQMAITLGDSVRWTLQLFEWAGVESVADKTATNSGTSTSPDTGTTAATTQTHELELALLAAFGPSATPVTFFSPSGSFIEARQGTYTVPGEALPVLRAGVYRKNVTAIGTANMGATLPSALPWVGIVATFKAKPVAVAAPEGGRLRAFAKRVLSASRLHVVDEAGVESAVVLGKTGEVWRAEFVSFSVNVNAGALVNAHSGGSDAVTVAGLDAGDKILMADFASAANYLRVELDITAANTVTVRWFNTDASNRTPGSITIEALVIHRT